MSSIRILLADDHALVRQGTRRILEEHPDFEVIGEAEDGEQALELNASPESRRRDYGYSYAETQRVDVVRKINRSSPKTRILILSAYDDDEYIFGLLKQVLPAIY
jgi:DNA-binding NarL/FixJ family response regulator